MAKATSGKEVLAKFFDEGAYQTLYADANGAVTAAFGSANGTPVYAVCQNGAAMSVKDTEKVVKVLDMAGKTGNPVVTFYNSIGAKLEEGLAALAGSANVAAAVAKLSGVVPQIAVVTGVCGAGSALAAAGADICVMSKEGELFLTAPFTSAASGDKVENAGSAEYAAKAGVASIVVDTAEAAAVKAAAAVAKLSGVVPQIAVVTGVCGAGSALAAAGADICVMSKEGELFLTAPFTSAASGDKVENAGSAEYAAKAGVASIVVDTAEAAAVKAAELVALLPANNLAGAAVFEAAAPSGALNLAKYVAADAVKALVDADSTVELYAGYGKNVVTALATVSGGVVGVVATEGALCRECVSKIARFVRLCDAFSVRLMLTARLNCMLVMAKTL